MLKGFRFFNVARLYVEFDLVNPRPERPDEQTKPSSPTASDVGNLDMGTRHERRLNAYHAWPKLRRDVIRNYLRSSKEDIAGTVTVPDNFRLVRNADHIDRYFQVLKQLRHTDNPGQFLMTVKVMRGFVAPLHLIAGLMSRFDQDWAPVMADFNLEKIDAEKNLIEIGGKKVSLYALRSYQMFIFDCWLLWGPSIPICTCNQWQGQHTALQFGFGDENNSLPLLRIGNSGAEMMSFKELWTTVLARPISKYCSVTVRPCSSLVQDMKLCLCQRDVGSRDMGSAIVLDYVAHEFHSKNETANGYYSAYLWSMFIICHASGDGMPQPMEFHNGPDKDGTHPRPWLSMLPFFEHGNIADPDTYRSMKQQLAGKILSAIARLIKDCGEAGAYLRFCYACAIDDPGCNHQSDPGPPRSFGDSNAASGVGHTLRQTIQGMLAEAQFSDIQDKVVFSPDWQKNFASQFSACHLPTVVRKYYEHLDELKD